jgi:hypothetical protein
MKEILKEKMTNGFKDYGTVKDELVPLQDEYKEDYAE